MLHDDDLNELAALGVSPLPTQAVQGVVENSGARIWFADSSTGPAVVLLHGGMGHSNQWAHVVPELMAKGYRAILVDSRGQGRSTRDERPFSYDLMAEDTLAVMDHLGAKEATIIGWSDGAVTGLSMAKSVPHRIAGVYFFACNVDPSGVKPFEYTPIVGRMLDHQRRAYAALSPTPGNFDHVFEAVGAMQRTQPNYTKDDLLGIRVPVQVVIGEQDEFIVEAHLRSLASTLPNAQFEVLAEVSHFAPLQRPAAFAASVLNFLSQIHPTRGPSA